ncbi:MAG TPA: hypothetical protein VMV56_12040 [Williamwhitmania sp.]|nr:hypothetical protein [Williamwhitmania sp.]
MYHNQLTLARVNGQSSAPDYGYRYEDHADDVAGLILLLRSCLDIQWAGLPQP